MQLRLGKYHINLSRVDKSQAGYQTVPPNSPMGAMLSSFRSSGSSVFSSDANKDARLKAYTGYVHSCVSARAQRDAASRYILKDRRTGETIPEDKAPIPYSFFRKPNPAMSEFYFKSLICTWMNLCGTAPVLKVRNAAGVPVMQWPLLPNRVSAFYDPVDWVRYEYTDNNGATIKIPGKDMIFYRWPHPTKLFDGLGPLEGAGLFHDTDVLLWQYQKEMFSKGPFASWILQYPAENRTLTPDIADKIANNFEEIVGDREHPAYPVVLSGGAEAKQFPVTNKGLEVPTINEEIKERIRSAFHVSKTILGEVPGESRANVEGAEYGFYRFTEAYLKLLDEENERSVLWEFDGNITGEYELMTPEDKDFRLREESSDLQNKVSTINEVRSKRGFAPVDWGNDPWGTMSDVQIDTTPEPVAGQDTGTVAAGTEDVQKTALNGAQVTALKDIVAAVAMGTMPKKSAIALILMAFPEFNEADVTAMINTVDIIEPSSASTPGNGAAPSSSSDETEDDTEEEEDTPADEEEDAAEGEDRNSRMNADKYEERRNKSRAFVEFQSKWEQKVLAELRKILDKEEKKVVAKVEKLAPRLLSIIAECRTKAHAKSILKNRSAIDDIADMEEFAEEYMKINPFLQQLYIEAGTAIAKGYGLTFEVNKLGLVKIAKHLEKSTDAILKTTASKIRDELQEGFIEGEGVGDLINRIRDIYEGISRDRAITIARTETVAPANLGAIEGYKQAGVTKKEWITTMDGHAREEHEDADGQTVSIDDPFSVGGESLLYPGDENGSAGNVINCRCTVAGVIEGD